MVQRALAGGDPAQALAAAHLLKRCTDSDAEVRGLFEARDQQPWFLSKLGLGVDKMIENAQAFQRGCQALDAAARARTGDLYQQAYAGGAPNSALPYLQWLQREGSEAPAAALVTDLQRQIRKEAEAADFGTLMAVALTHDPQGLGLSDVDKAGFERAWLRTQEADLGQEMLGKIWGPLFNLLKLLGDKPPELTPAQEAEAQALSERVFAVYLRRKQALR